MTGQTQQSQAEIFVRFTHAAFHNWPGPPAHREYLSFRHRHLFAVEVRCLVKHDEREIEYHDLIDEAKIVFQTMGGPTTLDLGTRSCEAMARELAETLARRHQRQFTVIVSEDGEAGALVHGFA